MSTPPRVAYTPLHVDRDVTDIRPLQERRAFIAIAHRMAIERLDAYRLFCMGVSSFLQSEEFARSVNITRDEDARIATTRSNV